MAASGPFFQNIKIIIVDDQSDVRLLIARFLAEPGAQVFAAKNAFDGLRLVRKIRPDVVLSHLNMPGRSGFGLLTDIRALSLSNGGSVPVIAITAHEHKEDLILGAGLRNS